MIKWEMVELGKCVDFFSGFAWKADKFSESGNIPIIRIQNINSDSKFIYWNDVYDDRFLIKKGDILLSLSGSIKTCVWDGPVALLNQRIVKLTPQEKLDSRYFFRITDYLIGKIEGMGKHALVNNVSVNDLKAFKIPLPPLPTQRQIAEVLDTADALRRCTQEQLAALDELAQGLFLEMFGDVKRNNKNWPIQSFDYFAVIDTDMTSDFEKYAEYPHIGIANIEKDTGKLINYELVKNENLSSGKYIFGKEHIIYSKIRPNLNKVALPDFEGLCSADSYPILVRKENANRLFFAYLLRSEAFLDFIIEHSSRTNIPKVNKQQISQFKGVAPPIELQNQFAAIIENIEEQKAVLRESLRESEALFGGLLQRVFG